MRKINELFYVLFANTLFNASRFTPNRLNLRFFIFLPLIRYNQVFSMPVDERERFERKSLEAYLLLSGEKSGEVGSGDST